MKKLVVVHCPLCKGTLEFNRDNGRIERHWAAGQKQEAPDLLSTAEQAARKAAEDVDMAGLTRRAQEKSAGLESAFEDAARKAREAVERGEKPENPFDLD
jgi:uncharacterized protein YbaR (Trm112 family)